MNAIPRIWVLGTACLAVAGCGQKNVYQPPPPPSVTVALPLRQTVTNYLEETGTTEPVGMVAIRARVRGFLEKVEFEPGQDVQAGDPLYVIQQREFQAKVDAAQAELKAQEADRDRAKIERDRQVNLQREDPGATSEVAVVKAVAEFNAAEADVLAAQATLDQAQLDLEYTVLKAPIDGRVGKTLVKKGNLVGDDGATHLTTIVNYDPIYANFNISERALLKLSEAAGRKENDEVDESSIKLQLRRANDSGFPFHGNVDYADLGVDQSTGTFLVRGIFPNPQRKILPGLFVRVRIPLEKNENALLVPERAVGADQAGRYVLIVNREGLVERRDVTLGMKYGEMLVVEKGLQGDERVIVEGIQRSRPGAKVTPKTTELSPVEGELETVQQGSQSPIDDDQQPVAPADETLGPKETTGQPRPQPAGTLPAAETGSTLPAEKSVGQDTR